VQRAIYLCTSTSLLIQTSSLPLMADLVITHPDIVTATTAAVLKPNAFEGFRLDVAHHSITPYASLSHRWYGVSTPWSATSLYASSDAAPLTCFILSEPCTSCAALLTLLSSCHLLHPGWA
jgi:hypothetical protein